MCLSCLLRSYDRHRTFAYSNVLPYVFIINSGVPSKRKVRELQRLLDILPTCIAVSVKQGELSTHAVGCQLDVGVSEQCQFDKLQLCYLLLCVNNECLSRCYCLACADHGCRLLSRMTAY
jgi:hypothetical protein